MGFVKSSIIVLGLAVLISRLPGWFREKPPIIGNASFVAPGWEKVAETLKDLRDTGREAGGAFAVYHKGALVFEGHAGWADEDARVPFDVDTLTIIYSTSKMLGALCIAILSDRGLIDYGKPVAQYWPDFAQNGKGKVTVEQLLSHQAGLSHLDEPWTMLEPERDPEGMGRKLAAQKPHWTPGEQHGYHGITIGLYVDQLVRKVDPKHRSVSRFFAEEIAKKFDLDVFLGLPLEENHRCATLYKADMTQWSNLKRLCKPDMLNIYYNLLLKSDSLTAKMAASPTEMSNPGMMNNPQIRTASNPSLAGYASATSLAKLMGVVASGGSAGGKKLLSPATLAKLTEVMSSGYDATLLSNTTFSRGPLLMPSPAGNILIGHPGAGGNMGYADLERQLGFAYVTNHASVAMGDDPRYMALLHSVYEAYKGVIKMK